MGRAAAILVVSLPAHGALGRFLLSPWFMPDLSLVGLVLALQRAPERRLLLLVLAALGVMLLAGPAAGIAGGAYLAAGGLLIWSSARWDFRAPAMQGAGVAAAEILLVAVWSLAGSAPASWLLAGSAAAKIALTVAWWWIWKGWSA